MKYIISLKVCIQSLFIDDEQIFNGENNDRAHFWFDTWNDNLSKPGCSSYENSMLAESFSFQNRRIIYSGCNPNGYLKYFNDSKIGKNFDVSFAIYSSN